jgi:hypothetical protein
MKFKFLSQLILYIYSFIIKNKMDRYKYFEIILLL